MNLKSALFIVSLWPLAVPGFASGTGARPAGVAIFATGEVTARGKADSDSARRLEAGAPLYEGDRVKTGANGRAALAFLDGSQMKLNYNTDVQLKSKDIHGEKNLRGINAVKLFLGGIWTKVAHNPKATFDIETSAAVAAVKGCDGEASADEDGARFFNWHDLKSFKVSNDFGAASMQDGQEIVVKKGNAPAAAVKFTGRPSSWIKGAGGAATEPGQIVRVKLKGKGIEEVIELRLK